jgi:hypothetical protein
MHIAISTAKRMGAPNEEDDITRIERGKCQFKSTDKVFN